MPAPSVISELTERVKRLNYSRYLVSANLSKVRGFTNKKVSFDFPVTALIGTNGGGKSTILGAAAIAYKNTKPGTYFPKSSVGDDSMANWSIEFELLDRGQNASGTIKRTASFKNLKWARDRFFERELLIFPIFRTVPAGERTNMKKYIGGSRVFTPTGQATLTSEIAAIAGRILAKDLSRFQRAVFSERDDLYVGDFGGQSYSEFHFGAGESSVIRMISQIENAPDFSLILIEEIENGLHPKATQAMVEYLVEVASRKKVQAIFTTHSEFALKPLPPQAIWAAVPGDVQQGKLSIESLRAIVGTVEKKLAVFVEDLFAKEMVEAIIRHFSSNLLESIGVYDVGGDANVRKIHNSHEQNPSIQQPSIGILDGDSQIAISGSIIKLPGQMPERLVFDYVAQNVMTLASKLAMRCQIDTGKQDELIRVVGERAVGNADRHIVFAEVGDSLGFTAENIVRGAFIKTWIEGNVSAAQIVFEFIKARVPQ